jgi:putative heme transporter
VPLAWASFFAIFMMPLVEWMESKRMRRGLAIIIAVLLFTGVIVGILATLSAQVVSISKDLPSISTRFSSSITRVQQFIVEDLGIADDTEELKSMIGSQLEEVVKWLFGNISSVGQSFFDLFLMPIYIYFILLYRDLPSRFIEKKYSESNQETIRKVFGKIQKVLRSYIVGISLFTAITAAMDIIIFLSLGLEYALFFSILVAILNLIPYVGNLIAMIIVVGYALVTKDSLLTPLLLVGLLWLANMIQENVVRPWVVGSSTEINAFAVFLSFIVGALVWGVSGMILFIPLVGIVKIILEEVPSLNAYAIFLKEWNVKPTEKKD